MDDPFADLDPGVFAAAPTASQTDVSPSGSDDPFAGLDPNVFAPPTAHPRTTPAGGPPTPAGGPPTPAGGPPTPPPAPREEPDIPNAVNVPKGASAREVVSGAIQNFIPDAKRNLAEIYMTIVHHPEDVGSLLKNAAIGVDSKIQEYAGVKQDPTKKAQDEATVDALGKMFVDRWGTLDDAGYTLANHPFSALADISTLAGGAGLAGKIPMIGEALEATRVPALARNVAALTNPLNPGGVLTGAGRAVSAGRNLLTGAGNISRDLDSQILAASGGRLNSAMVRAEGLARDTLSDAASETNGNAAIMRSAGLQPTLEATTGVKTPAIAQAAVDAANANNLAKITGEFRGISGAVAPDLTAVPAAIDRNLLGLKNTVDQGYAALRKSDFALHPDFASDLDPRINSVLNAERKGLPRDYVLNPLPTGTASLYPTTDAALANLRAVLNRASSADGRISAADLEGARQGLNEAWRQAQSGDRANITSIIKAFDDHVANSVVPPTAGGPGRLLKNGAPATVADIDEFNNTFTTARDAFRDLKENYLESKNPTIKAVSERLAEAHGNQDGLYTAASPADYRAVEPRITSALLDSSSGAMNAKALDDILGPDSVRAHVRQSLLDTTGNAPQRSAAELQTYLHDPNPATSVVGKHFSADEVRTLRLLNHSRSLMETPGKVVAERPGFFAGLGTRASRALVAGALGHTMSGGSFTSAAAAGIAEHLLEHGLGKISDRAKIARALQGSAPRGSLVMGAAKAGVKAGVGAVTNPTRLRNLTVLSGATRGVQPGATAQGPGATAQGPVANEALANAIRRQEGPGVSGQGAVMGIMPGTFARYAKPGERIDNPDDNLRVHRRIIDDLMRKSGGDWRRVAVGYFSGEGNIAPPGSPTPWIKDNYDHPPDRPGKSTSSYVADIGRRLGLDPNQPASNPSAPFVIGDSIGAGIAAAAKAPNATTVGASPTAVLNTIENTPDDNVRGKNIVLSGGASNNPAEVALVERQIRALQEKGAANITLVGVGDRPDFAGVNERLAEIANRTGARFTGALDPRNLSSDRVHPRNYRPFTVAASGGRIERASGGRASATSHKAAVTSLLNAVDRAKKTNSNATKTLLNVSDDTIARALSVANRAI